MPTEEYNSTPNNKRIFSQNLNLTLPVKGLTGFDTQSTLEQTKPRSSILGDNKFKMKKFVNKMRESYESMGGPKSDKKNFNTSMSIDYPKTSRAKNSEDSEEMRQVISILNDQII
jgi:hypothetical protein